MSDKLAKMYKTQKSFTEWLEDIKHKDVEALRREDNDKRERLKVLKELIGLPFDEPTQFEASDLARPSPKLKKYLKNHGDELCALRLIPKIDDSLPKLRMRGKSVREAYEWFKEQDIDSPQYRADFVPHDANSTWATIFIITTNGIFGEIIWGGHHQLTQGFHETDHPKVFEYNFKTKRWAIFPPHPKALSYAKKLVSQLRVDDSKVRTQLKEKLKAEFAENYLLGYFETTDSTDFGTWFKDYSPTLGKMYDDFEIKAPQKSAHLSGMVGSKGNVTAPVCIIKNFDTDADGFIDGSVLVCEVTTPDFVPLMQRAAAIVTDQGGILSHAAIVARELGVPCIVGTQHATKQLKDGQVVTVDAVEGIIF
jgi:phosphohistidine swiveling domain-containing protein